MTERLVYYLARQGEFEQAREGDFYLGSREDRADGFIHFSTASQVRESAHRHRAGETDLVLLEIDSESLGPNLKWEAARGGQLFPHLYGKMPLSAVQRSVALPLVGDRHQFPEWV